VIASLLSGPAGRKDLFPDVGAMNRYFFSVYSYWVATMRAMNLSESQKKFLRGLGHQLKPVIMVGDAGLSDGVLKEFASTIEHHELIKVRIRAGDRSARDEIIKNLCDKGSSSLVARIGNVALLYRRNEEKPRIPLPMK